MALLTEGAGVWTFLSQIPPTQLVDRSYSAYGSLQGRFFPQIPPTQLVDRSYSAYAAPLRKAFSSAVVNSPHVPA